MTLLHIIPKKNIENDCYLDAIITLMNYCRRRYELMFLEHWNFRFDRTNSLHEPETIGEQITIDAGFNFDALMRYHGVRFYLENIALSDSVARISYELSQGYPVIAFADAYDVPWDANYQKDRITHLFIINGIRENVLYCTDPYYLKDNLTLTIDQFQKCATGKYLFHQVVGEEMTDPTALFDCIRQSLASKQTNRMFTQISAFAEAILLLNPKNELNKCRAFNDAPLFIQLKKVSNTRTLFAGALVYMSELCQSTVLLEFAATIQSIGSDWNVIRGLLTKMYVTQQFTDMLLQKVSDQTHKVGEKERLLAEAMGNFLDNPIATSTYGKAMTKALARSEGATARYGAVKIVPVALTEHFNNTGFKKHGGKGDLSGDGVYFESANVPLRIGHHTLSLHTIYDNVMCSGQTIALAAEYYGTLCILGCSDYGNFTDHVTLRSEDGDSYPLSVGLSDWWSVSPVFNEHIAYTGMAGAEGKIKEYSNVSLFSIELVLPSDKPLISIKLPFCPNMHIFSMYMIVEKR